MVREAVKTARTIEEARSAALLELGLSEEDDFKVEVLKMPAKKIFGIFGGSSAEVRVTVEIPDREPKKRKDEPAPQKKKSFEKRPFEKKPPEKKPPEKRAVPEKKVMTEGIQSEKNDGLKDTGEYREVEAYISGVVKGLGPEKCDVRARANEEQVVFELDCGEDYGIVIGRRGETLDAIQYLARMVVGRRGRGCRRVSVNIGNYREKRVSALISLARRSAGKAVNSGRNITLEPMSSYERRIIHTAVQDVEGATSFSVGEDLNRRVVIAPENARVRGPERRGGRRGDRRPKREPYVPQIAPDREQKSDAAGFARYNKVEVKKDKGK